MTNVPALTAAELLAAYAARTLSPSEVWSALEPHIAAWEPKIHALYAYDPEGAREEAARSTERWARGAPVGPLDGVPVTVKEMVATRGVPVPLGTAATELTPALADAPPAARLREAGAIIFAKTTAPDFGMLSSGVSSFHETTRNPWDLAANPGGSSAGAGAAGAAGFGPLHLGTDIGGSIRLPAGWCGLVGLKPSLGRVPIDPYYVGRVAGPMTRTVDDAALMMQVLSQPDARDAMSLPPADIPWRDLSFDVSGLSLGLMMEAGCGMEVEDTVRTAVEAAARRFEKAGAKIVPVEPVVTRTMLDGLNDFWRCRSWAEIGAMPPERRAKVLPYIREWAEGGADIFGTRAVQGFNQTMEIRRSAARPFAQVDAVLSPVYPVARFPAEYASPLNDPQRPLEHICFTVPWNMAEQPAISVNCGFTAGGMPIGLQIVGPRFADHLVLRLAKAYEDMRETAMLWPFLA
jgi:aspartyl-tRNA(Asn)/glutamyl-tRNA(Gln) amidotransferase subunit A